MDEIEINIVENVEEVSIEVTEFVDKNSPNADTVTDDTIPANTDRNYFFSALTGWFYVTWQKLKTLLGASGGAFAQPVYLTNKDSEIEGYKTLSYDNDAKLTEIALSTDDEANVHLYPDGLDVNSLPAGPYFFRFRAKVSATVGDTYLRVTSFVRDLAGDETDLFTVDTEIINSTSYVDVGVRTVQPAFSVNSTDRYGIRITAITTHATAKTVTYQLGDGYSAYFDTPVALRHNLLRGRNDADAHSSDAISNSSEVDGDTVTDALNWLKENGGGGTVVADNVIRDAVKWSVWEQIPFSAFSVSGVTGSGAISPAAHRYLYIWTGGTAGSTSFMRTSRLASGYFRSASYVQFDYDKDMVLSLRLNVASPTVSTANSKKWVIIGANEGAAVDDPSYKSFGIRIEHNDIMGIVHDGTNLHEVNLNSSLNGAAIRDITIDFKAGNSIEWYVQGILKGTSTNIPTGKGDTTYNTFGVSITNGIDSADNRIIINDMKFWAQQ